MVLSLPFWQSTLLAYMLSINAVTLILFGLDKSFAKKNRRRIPESTLYMMILAGGTVGALIGMELFRHKRKKQSFLGMVILIMLIQLSLVFFLLTD